MGKQRSNPEKPPRLRKTAEEQLKLQQPATIKSVSEADLQKLIHELQTLQIELEKQKLEFASDKEKAMADAEARYQALADTGIALIWTSGTDKLCNFFNEPWLKFTGRTLEQEMGAGWTEGVHPDDFSHCLDLYTSSFDRREPFEMEYRLRFHDGSYRWILDIGTPCYDSSGNFNGYIGHCYDINDKKQAQKDLVDISERYRLANKATNDVIWDWDVVSDTQQWNETGTAVFGWTEIVERPVQAQWWVDRVHPVDRERVHDSFFAVVNNPECDTWHDNYRFLKADGTFAEVDDHGFVLRDKQGRATRMIGAMQDISRRKQAEDNLVAERDQFLSLFNNIDGAIYVADMDTYEILYISKFLESLLPPGSLGKPCYQVMQGFDSPCSFCTNDIIRRQKPEPYKWEYFNSVFKRFYSLVDRVIQWPDGREVRFEWALDITEQKEAEIALKESEKRFRILFATMAQGVVYQDNTGAITFANTAAERILGLSLAQMQGRTSVDPRWKAIHEDGSLFPGHTHPSMISLTTGKENSAVMGVFVPSEERYKWILVKAIPEFKDGMDMPYQVFTTFEDITELKNANNELAKAKEHLELTVEERTRDLKESNESLRESEERFYKMFKEHTAVMLLINPADGTIIQANDAAVNFYGLDFNGPTRNIMEINALDPADITKEMEVAEKQERNYFIFPHKLVSGEIRTVEVHSTPIEVRGKKVLFSIIHDITEREELETALKLQSAAFESFALPIIITDITGRIEWANSAFTKLTGYSTKETIGKMPGELVKSGKADKDFYKRFWETILSKKVWSGELINRRKDGTLYYEEETITPVLDAQGNISRFIAIKIDITERKKLYTELAEEKRRLADIIKGTNAGTWEWNIQTGETIFNEQWANIIGYTLDEISPVSIETWMKFAHPDDLIASGELLEMHFKGETDYYSFQSRMKHKSGEWVWVLDNGRLHEWDENGKPLLMSGTHLDITLQKRIEEALVIAKNEADKANRAKSEFLSRMSHELRTPMNSILGFAQLLEMENLSLKQRKGVAHILKNGKHLLELINEVLDIARIEAGRQILTKQPVQLAPVIHEVTDSIQVAADKRHITINFIDSPDSRLSVSADSLRLKQVLINLLSNAVKYNREGGSVTIQASSHLAGEQGSKMAIISISDTGYGISPEDINRLFQPFERIGAEQTGTEGTGLGLMVVKKFIEAMDGRVEVESAVGIGTTFRIELPVASEQQPEINLIKDPMLQANDPTQETRTILYIEDNLSNIELVEDILTEFRPNLLLITSHYGKQAVELSIKHMPSLILLDLNLPDTDGPEVLEMLLADSRTKEIPVIVISADAMPYQIEKLISAGAREYLPKPLDIVNLLNTIDKYINR